MQNEYKETKTLKPQEPWYHLQAGNKGYPKMHSNLPRQNPLPLEGTSEQLHSSHEPGHKWSKEQQGKLAKSANKKESDSKPFKVENRKWVDKRHVSEHVRGMT